MTTETRRNLIKDFDRIESVLATESKEDGDNADEMAGVAAYWSDFFNTRQDDL